MFAGGRPALLTREPLSRSAMAACRRAGAQAMEQQRAAIAAYGGGTDRALAAAAAFGTAAFVSGAYLPRPQAWWQCGAAAQVAALEAGGR